MELSRRVFGDALDPYRVRVARLPRGRLAFVVGRTIHMSPAAPADLAAAPPWAQAWLAHELTHVWQFQTRPWRTLGSWLGVLLSGGYGPGAPGYRYRLPLTSWDDYNLEQQARLVEHSVLLQLGAGAPDLPQGATLSEYRKIIPFSG